MFSSQVPELFLTSVRVTDCVQWRNKAHDILFLGSKMDYYMVYFSDAVTWF